MCIDTMDNVHITPTELTVYKLVRMSPEKGVYYSLFKSDYVDKQKNHKHKILTYSLNKLIIDYPGVYVIPNLKQAQYYFYLWDSLGLLLEGKIPANTIIRKGRDTGTNMEIFVTEKFIPTKVIMS